MVHSDVSEQILKYFMAILLIVTMIVLCKQGHFNFIM